MYEYLAYPIRVIDGDTFVADWDMGGKIWLRDTHFRIRGIDAPDKKLYPVKYRVSKDFLTDLLLLDEDSAPPVGIRTNKPPAGYEPKSLERYVVDITYRGSDLATIMIDNGYAVSWSYRKGDPHPPQEP